MLNIKKLLFLVSFFFSLSVFAADRSEELKLMHIGNSFSWNSTEYLPQLAEAGKKKIGIFAASKGGCSLQCHADFLKKAQRNEPEGNVYKATEFLQKYSGTMPSLSLVDALKAVKWDVITIQQASRQSYDLDSYEPHGNKLLAQIKLHAPSAKILLHKTWAYHDEHPMFKQTLEGPHDHLEMHKQITKAYRQFGEKYQLPLIPSADAILLAYQQLPKAEKVEITSEKEQESIKLSSNMLYSNDGYHLDIAGKYLTACVWYEIIFNESVVSVDYFPEGLDADYALALRELAHQVVNQKGVE